MNERAAMTTWLLAHCPLKIEYDFWYDVYDDLADCFDDMEPWVVMKRYGAAGTWHSWDKPFTGRMIAPDDETRNELEDMS